MKWKAVLFDMDGVLIDSEPGYHRVNKVFFENLGLPFTQKEVSSITGSTAPVIAEKILTWKPDLPYSIEELSASYIENLFSSLKTDVHQLIPGATDWMDRLIAFDIKLGIGSSSSYGMVHYITERFDLDRRMDTIVVNEDVKRGKPDPEIYLKCCQNLGLHSSEALVIEDSRNGILAAKAAGCMCAAFLGTHQEGMDVSMADLSFPAFDNASFSNIFDLNL